MKHAGSAASVMLFYKNAHCFIKHFYIIQTSFFSAFTFEMNHAGSGKIIIFKSSLLNSETQIYVFTVHKKLFIKTTGYRKNFFGDHHESSGENIYFMIFIFIQITEMVF